MKKIKPYILPAAIVLGLLLHSWLKPLVAVIPYVIFGILLINFCSVSLKSLKLNKLDVWCMAFQTVVSIVVYYFIRMLGGNEILAQGAMITVICPVASSVVVVAYSLGVSRTTTTGYTIYGNLLVTVVAPFYFSFIGENQTMPFWDSALLIFCHIAPVIALPFFVALGLQFFAPKVKQCVGDCLEFSLLLWAVALLVTLGSTIDYIFIGYEGNELTICLLGVASLVLCALQFATGRVIGKRYGESVAGGQLLGQKNTAMGIWMATVYLAPLSSVSLAFYSIAQNLFNSWQLWHQRSLK